MSFEGIGSAVQWRRKDQVIRAFENAGVTVTSNLAGSAAQRNDRFRQLLERYYRIDDPSRINTREVVDQLLNKANEIAEQRRIEQSLEPSEKEHKARKEAHRWRKSHRRTAREIIKEIASRMEHVEDFDKYPDWSNYDEAPLKLPEPSPALRDFERSFEQLQIKPYGTEISLAGLSEHEYREVGSRLLKWFDETIMPHINERMLVVYNIRGRSENLRCRVSVEVERIRRMLTENTVFEVSEDASGIKSGDNANICLEWLDSIKFLNFENIPDNRPANRRSYGCVPERKMGVWGGHNRSKKLSLGTLWKIAIVKLI